MSTEQQEKPKKKASEKKTNNVKNIQISFVDGSDARVIKASNDDWGIVAYKIEKGHIGSLNKHLMNEPGIYFLFSENKHGIYVGQADKRNNGRGLLARLQEHVKSKTELYRDKWITAVAVCGLNDWDSATLKNLEYQFYHMIHNGGGYERYNSTEPNRGSSDISTCDEKVDIILQYLSSFGIHTLEEHIESSLGGVTYDLNYGKSSVSEYTTPPSVVEKMLDMLPKEVWKPDTKFFDPACKEGEFLYAIYKRLMDSPVMKSMYINPEARRKHILKEQLYGIAISELSLDLTLTSLEDEESHITHIMCIDSYSNKLHEIINGKNNNTLVELMRKLGVPDMKFDVVISNPPFTEVTGGGDRRTMTLK